MSILVTAVPQPTPSSRTETVYGRGLELVLVRFGYPFSNVAWHFLWTRTGPSVAMIHHRREAKARDGWGTDF